MGDKVQCTKCHWIGDEVHVRKEVIYPGSLEEPPEYIDYCPDCNEQDSLEDFDQPLCRVCDEVQVSDYGEICPECYEEDQERRADAINDRREEERMEREHHIRTRT